MGKKYENLSHEERAQMQAELKTGCALWLTLPGLRAIRASAHRRNQRLLVRSDPQNDTSAFSQAAFSAQDHCLANPTSNSTSAGNAMWKLVLAGLAQGLLPWQVSVKLAGMKPGSPIGTRSIYSTIYVMSRCELRAKLIALMR